MDTYKPDVPDWWHERNKRPCESNLLGLSSQAAADALLKFAEAVNGKRSKPAAAESDHVLIVPDWWRSEVWPTINQLRPSRTIEERIINGFDNVAIGVFLCFSGVKDFIVKLITNLPGIR